jgi:hypothetical protein
LGGFFALLVATADMLVVTHFGGFDRRHRQGVEDKGFRDALKAIGRRLLG